MLENPTQTAAAPNSAPLVKQRYAPPNQRNRPLNRRKSGDRFDRANNLYANDGEKNQFASSRNTSAVDHGDTGSSNVVNVNSQPKLIYLEGFSRSEGAQLLKERWETAQKHLEDASIDSSERPVLYSSGLPDQMLLPKNSMGPSTGFLVELHRKMQNTRGGFDN